MYSLKKNKENLSAVINIISIYDSLHSADFCKKSNIYKKLRRRAKVLGARIEKQKASLINI